MILRRIEGSRFSEVLPAWRDETVVILGGGPSLTHEQVVIVAAAVELGAARSIAVNDAYLLAPWADVQYAADSHWHKWHTEGVEKPGLKASEVAALWKGFAGQKCTIESSGANVTDEAVHMLRNRDHPNYGLGLSLNPEMLVTGRNSGFQSLNLAILAGAKRVILLGFDGKPSAEGKAHWFGEHPRPTPPAAYPLYRQAMSAAETAILEAGVQVVNASPGSAIDAFPKVRLEDVL